MAKLMAMSRPGIPRKPIRIMASRSMSELWECQAQSTISEMFHDDRVGRVYILFFHL